MPFPSSATTIVDLPDELVLDIFGRLPSEDAVSMLRVTPQLHFLAARVLYTNVRAAGLNGRRFFATLASKTARSTVYATFLRRLRYTFTSPSDAYLTYPVLCQALLTMNHLISLTLDVSASQADMLTLCLQRYGLLRTRILLGARLLATAQGRQTPTFGHGLPALQGLRIRGAITAGALLCHRPVKELVLATPLNYTGLSELCCLLDRSHHGDRLVTLIVRLTGALNASDVLAALGEVTPNLEQLALDQPGLDVLDILSILVGPNPPFKFIRRISLNIATIPPKSSDMCTWLTTAMAPTSMLTGLSIGDTIWSLDPQTYQWTPSFRQRSIIKLSYLNRFL